jgi:hypothetical protein
MNYDDEQEVELAKREEALRLISIGLGIAKVAAMTGLHPTVVKALYTTYWGVRRKTSVI